MNRSAEIRAKCEEAGCSDEIAKKHYRHFVYGFWDPHPPDDFENWWLPHDRDKESGADIGGHIDAKRQWSRKEPGRYVHATYGVSAADAWNSAVYAGEYQEWVDAGRPEKAEPFVSMASSIADQMEFWKGLREGLALIHKPMPKTHMQVRNPLTNKPKEDFEDEPVPF
jgi:hypothetical protein